MGAFYGSVQVRSADRDRVKAAAEEVARQQQIHMLLGPVLGGWIGVYPEGSGQDDDVGREIARRLKGDVLHFSFMTRTSSRIGSIVTDSLSTPSTRGRATSARRVSPKKRA
jgi:hypothetical protein